MNIKKVKWSSFRAVVLSTNRSAKTPDYKHFFDFFFEYPFFGFETHPFHITANLGVVPAFQSVHESSNLFVDNTTAKNYFVLLLNSWNAIMESSEDGNFRMMQTNDQRLNNVAISSDVQKRKFITTTKYGSGQFNANKGRLTRLLDTQLADGAIIDWLTEWWRTRAKPNWFRQWKRIRRW